MQLTKELLNSEIERIKASVEEMKALLHQRNGALIVMQDLVRYMEMPEPVAENTEAISAENAEIQARDEQYIRERAEMADAVTDKMVEEAVDYMSDEEADAIWMGHS